MVKLEICRGNGVYLLDKLGTTDKVMIGDANLQILILSDSSQHSHHSEIVSCKTSCYVLSDMRWLIDLLLKLAPWASDPRARGASTSEAMLGQKHHLSYVALSRPGWCVCFVLISWIHGSENLEILIFIPKTLDNIVVFVDNYNIW
jgi:hypothetical protein